MTAARRLLPGLAVATMIAIAARLAGGILPKTISEIAVAVLLGLLVAAAIGAGVRAMPVGEDDLRPGIAFATQRLLRLGIVLLGARLGLDEVARIGLPSTVVVVVTMVLALTLVLGLARLAHLEPRLSVLLAVGAAVCGNSAIVATAPVVGARAREVAYAVGTVTLFGTLAVFVYPLLGAVLGLGDTAFGLWAGIAIHDTSQVVAAGAAYSPEALDVATVVKLIRNALMAPLLLVIAWSWPRTGAAAGDPGGDVGRGLRRAVPLFVLGFLALTVLRSAGLIGADLAAAAGTVSGWLIVIALAAVGLSIRVAELRAIGPRSFAVGFGAAAILGIGALVAILGLGLDAGLGG